MHENENPQPSETLANIDYNPEHDRLSPYDASSVAEWVTQIAPVQTLPYRKYEYVDPSSGNIRFEGGVEMSGESTEVASIGLLQYEKGNKPVTLTLHAVRRPSGGSEKAFGLFVIEQGVDANGQPMLMSTPGSLGRWVGESGVPMEGEDDTQTTQAVMMGLKGPKGLARYLRAIEDKQDVSEFQDSLKVALDKRGLDRKGAGRLNANYLDDLGLRHKAEQHRLAVQEAGKRGVARVLGNVKDRFGF